jgi:hypothetical protein
METAYKYLVDRGYEDYLNDLEVEDSITVAQIQAMIDEYTEASNLNDESQVEAFDTGYDLGYAMALAKVDKHAQEVYKKGYIERGIEELTCGKEKA